MFQAQLFVSNNTGGDEGVFTLQCDSGQLGNEMYVRSANGGTTRGYTIEFRITNNGQITTIMLIGPNGTVFAVPCTPTLVARRPLQWEYSEPVADGRYGVTLAWSGEDGTVSGWFSLTTAA